MKPITTAFFTAAAVLLFFPYAVSASGTAPSEIIKTELKASTTAQAQVKTADAGYTDFDALSEVNDPLFREGSKELLQQISKEDAPAVHASVVKKPVLRDALNSKKAPARKKVRVKKTVQAGKGKAADPL